MREIKFRAWDIKRKVMHTIRQLEFSDEGDEPFSYEAAQVRFEGEWLWLQRDEYILLEFTGLLDKNGKEVYEGDIVKWYKPSSFKINIYEVRTITGGWELASLPHLHYEQRDTVWLAEFDQPLEVIGTIHENPELLKDEEFSDN